MNPVVRPLFKMPAASRNNFVDAMSKIASTVHVVTTDGPHGRAGMTVTAMTSVSADAAAPTLLVCLNLSSNACSTILKNGVFCVNALREDQSHVSDVFAGKLRTSDGEKFSCESWVRAATGSPRLINPMVAFDCRVCGAQLIGTHQVVFAEVADVFIAPDVNPLLYVGRHYSRLANGVVSHVCSNDCRTEPACNDAA